MSQKLDTDKLNKAFQVVDAQSEFAEERWLQHREEWEAATKHQKLFAHPPHVDIEVTNACNLRCAMCERNDMTRPVGLMSMDTFKNIIDQCEKLDVKSVKLNLWGESLCHPQFFEMIEYAHAHNVYTQFNTNTNYLKEDVADKLLASSLDRVSFSIESIDHELYEATRCGNNFEKIMKQVEYFIEKKPVGKKPYLTIQFLKMKRNVHLLDSYVKHFQGRVDFVSVTNVGSITYNPRIIDEALIDYKKYPKVPCASLWQRLSIYWNGDVTVCCSDSDGFLTIGSIKDNTIEELWHGKKLNELRKRHMNLDFDGLICEKCTSNHKCWG